MASIGESDVVRRQSVKTAPKSIIRMLLARAKDGQPELLMAGGRVSRLKHHQKLSPIMRHNAAIRRDCCWLRAWIAGCPKKQSDFAAAHGNSLLHGEMIPTRNRPATALVEAGILYATLG